MNDTVTAVETPPLSARGFLLTGFTVGLLGLVAVAFPVVASVAVGMTAGALVLLAGIAVTFHAILMKGWGGQILSLLGGLVTVAAGLALIFFPLSGLVALTALVVGYLIVNGVLKIALGLTLRPAARWGWPVVSGGLGIALAAVILWSMPLGVAWVLGLLVGVDLLLTGAWMVAIGLTLRKSRREQVAELEWRGLVPNVRS